CPSSASHPALHSFPTRRSSDLNKVSWFGQNLMGYWTGATTQCRIDCDQEVFLIPVLANRETIGDHVPGYGSNEDQEVGFLEEVVGWFRSPITHWSNI